MGIGERSRERVEAVLEELQGAYGPFPVDQTTLALPDERYERAYARYVEGAVDTYVELRNDADEVLQVRKDGRFELPGTVGNQGGLERAVRRAAERQAGVALEIDGVSGVTIVGHSNVDAPDDAVIYRLAVVFGAEYAGGEPTDGAEWRREPADLEPAYV